MTIFPARCSENWLFQTSLYCCCLSSEVHICFCCHLVLSPSQTGSHQPLWSLPGLLVHSSLLMFCCLLCSLPFSQTCLVIIYLVPSLRWLLFNFKGYSVIQGDFTSFTIVNSYPSWRSAESNLSHYTGIEHVKLNCATIRS